MGFCRGCKESPVRPWCASDMDRDRLGGAGRPKSSGQGPWGHGELIEEYLAMFRPSTAACYRRDLAHFEAELAKGGTDLLKASRADLRRWLGAQEHAGVSPNTIRRRVAGVAGLYQLLVDEGILLRSPVHALRRPPGGSALRLGLDAKVLARLLRAARDEGEDSELLVGLLVLGGLRVSEACGIVDEDLVVHEGYRGVLVRRKGGRVELVGLPKQVAELAWRVAERGPGPLLRGKRGGTLGRQEAWRRVRRVAARAGIPDKVYPHLLRHSHVTQALLAGVPLVVVQGSVGHRDVRSTLQYAQALGAMGALAGQAVAQRLKVTEP